MNTRDDAFAETLRQQNTDTRRKTTNTDDLRNSPQFRGFEETVREVLADVHRKAVRPWKIFVICLVVGYFVMIVLSVVQSVTWTNP